MQTNYENTVLIQSTVLHIINLSHKYKFNIGLSITMQKKNYENTLKN